MTEYDPEIHHRRSIRLNDYDYSSEGACFITICTRNREFLFGNVDDAGMRLNDAGRMVKSVWDELPSYYPGVENGEFVIMPNHAHGIVLLVGAGPRACPPDSNQQKRNYPDRLTQDDFGGQPQGVAPTAMTLFDVVHRFKSLTTHKYIQGVRNRGWQPFDKHLWQRNYYEHIIRNGESHARIAEYIRLNPANWATDRNNPDVKTWNDSISEIEEWLESCHRFLVEI